MYNANRQDWPNPLKNKVYDRMFVETPAKEYVYVRQNLCKKSPIVHRTYMALANPVYT